MSTLHHIKIDIKHLRDDPDQRHPDFSLSTISINHYIKTSISVTAILVTVSVMRMGFRNTGTEMLAMGSHSLQCSAEALDDRR